MDTEHRQTKIWTPHNIDGSSLIAVDEGLVDFLREVWSFEDLDGNCRTYASCQGNPGGHGYVMVQSSFALPVMKLIPYYFGVVTEAKDCWNGAWARNVWHVIRWKNEEND